MILVIGATGNIGRPLVKILLSGEASVRALTRDPGSAGLPAGTQVVRGDLDDPASLAAAFDGIDSVFLVARLSALTKHTRAVLDAARHSARRLVFVSSLSATTSLGDSISRWNKEAEDLIRQSGLGWTFLRAGAFMSNTLEWAESIRASGVAPTFFGNVPAVPVDPRDIAEIAALALRSDDYLGQALPVTGSERLSPAEQVQILSQVLGRSLRTREVPAEIVRAAFAWFGSPADVDRTIEVLSSTDVPWAHPVPTIEDLLGRAPRTFRQWATEHAAAFG
jgi:uncharacterized protein YbjT (DUF2867 family)